MKIKSVEPIYTGGNIYVFMGAVDDNFFLASSCDYDVRIIDEDPRNHTSEERFGFEEWASAEWQEEHIVKDLEPSEAVEFFLTMLLWIKNNEPDGNYMMSDMTYFEEELKHLHGNDWR